MDSVTTTRYNTRNEATNLIRHPTRIRFMLIPTARSGWWDRSDQWRDLAPAPGEDKLLERLACARREFPLAQAFRQRVQLALVAEREGRHRIPALGDAIKLARLLDAKARHLVHDQAQRGGLKDQACARHSDIVEGVAVWLAAPLENELCHREHKDRSALRPRDIPLHQDAEQAGMLDGVLPCGHQIGPGLLVVG